MRPAGEVSLALLQAAHAIRRERAASGQGATLRELVHRSQVGYQVARDLVPKLKSGGKLKIIGTRRVPGRNRPVAEYAPVVSEAAPADVPSGPCWVDLSGCLKSWGK